MTRFDADAPAERRKLFAEAVRAHRQRSSPYLTVEVEGAGTDGDPDGGDDPVSLSGGGDAGDGGIRGIDDRGSGDASDRGIGGVEDGSSGDGGSDDGDIGEGSDAGGKPPLDPPWAQFGDGVVNLDCTDEELDRLKDLVGEYPAFRIDELNRPEDAAGTNVRITARADAKRLADFFEETFRRVYGRPEDYRAWVVEV